MQKYLARIREEECIGCTKCIQACPVDAIIGSNQLLHTVLITECIGCGLCVPPCPVDCIDMVAVDELFYDPEVAKQRAKARKIRLVGAVREPPSSSDMKASILASVARAKAKRSG